MQVGTVLGTAITTIKHSSFNGERLVLVQLEGMRGQPDGEPVLAFDRLGAAKGERVVLTSDSDLLHEMLGRDTPGRWSIMGLPDGPGGMR